MPHQAPFQTQPRLSQIAPSIVVIYQGYRVLEHNASKKLTRVRQTWITLVIARNVAQTNRGDAARDEAGLIAGYVYQSLAGFRPIGAAGPIGLADAQPAQYQPGLFLLPLSWQCDVILSPP